MKNNIKNNNEDKYIKNKVYTTTLGALFWYQHFSGSSGQSILHLSAPEKSEPILIKYLGDNTFKELDTNKLFQLADEKFNANYNGINECLELYHKIYKIPVLIYGYEIKELTEEIKHKVVLHSDKELTVNKINLSEKFATDDFNKMLNFIHDVANLENRIYDAEHNNDDELIKVITKTK